MRRPLIVVCLLSIASPAAAETVRIGYDESVEVKGVTVGVEVRGHAQREDGGADGDFALVVRKGEKQVEEQMSGEAAVMEVIGFGLQVVARGGVNDVELTVTKAGKVKKGKLDSDGAIEKAQAEAAKRRIQIDGAGAMAQGGVIRVWLTDGKHDVVEAAIGERSRKLLWFEIDPYAAIAPAKRKGAKTITLTADGPETWKVGGIAIERPGNTWVLRKGKKELSIEGKTWFETVALGKLVQVRGNDLVIAAATKLRRTDAARAQAKVEDEAARRGIRYDTVALSHGDGIHLVMLEDGKDWVVLGVVGERSGDLLAFDVWRPGEGGAPPPEEPAEPDEPDETTSSTSASDDVAQRLVAAHNAYRTKHCAADLAWSDELAKVAQAWADQLKADGCAFDHSQTEYGENLAAGTAGSLTPEDVVAMWYDEIADYDFDRGGFSMKTGHFTQVVWKRTKKLGCGKTTCDGMDIWVCNYDPAGNMEGDYRKNVVGTGC